MNKHFFILLLGIILFASCNPEAKWETTDVEIGIDVQRTSAGFITCQFTTNKEAYYMIDIIPALPGYDMTARQKQFMMLALDSANVAYLEWRHDMLEKGETNIAPFSSHALQYGDVKHTFTLLEPDSAYWIYAFVVNPVTMAPAGKLFFQKVHTAAKSTVQVSFEYRVKGYWDYIYPVDSTGAIIDYYPYVGASCDSVFAMETFGLTPAEYLYELLSTMASPEVLQYNVLYGVKATNNGWDGISHVYFEKGRVYYTAIAGCDGNLEAVKLYRFKWTGEKFEAFFKDEDSIVVNGENG